MICALTFALLARPALAQEAGAGQDMQSHLDQARFFAKRRWFPDAELEIAAALATPEGAASFEALWLGAQIAWELTDGEAALARAEAAAERAPSQDQADMALAFADGVRRDIGYLRVDAPYPGVVSRLQLEPQTAALDPAINDFANRAALRWRDRTALPVTLSLPAGPWLVNGVPATVVADQQADLTLPMRNVGNSALAALQVSRLELSAGVAGWVGDATDPLLPAARGQLSWTQPAGPLLIGLVGEVDLQGYSRADHQTRVTPLGGGLGVRIGTEIFVGGPLGVRPSLTARYARVPGIEQSCAPASAQAGAWTCGWAAPESGPADHIYVASPAWLTGAELLVEHREAGRTTALGTGVKLGVEHAFGRLPAAGEALGDDGTPYAWTTTDRAWSGNAISMLANVAIAF